ncbi:MAG: NAD(P)-dependent oxidoreductase [Aeriscardovia sp.]|nr:NAD(P)-dependent oxidoreductase [Aeriscardovia sp.]
MIIAIAGSSGFVGRHVCSIFQSKGHTIYPIDITSGLDLCDVSIINKVPRIDCFIHLANLVYVPASYEDPLKFYRVNYLTTLHALEICRKWDAKLVYISSYIYGPPQYLPVDEKHPVCPFNPYAQTKVICEKLCEGYHRDFGTSISIIRPFNLYGVGQKGKLLIPEIFEQIKTGKKEIQLKAASPRRDYVNVIDVAKAICLCAERKGAYDVCNVCSGESVSVKEITEIINKNLRGKVQFLFSQSDRPNEVDETRGSCEKLKSLGWTPSITFEEGIKAIIKSENL